MNAHEPAAIVALPASADPAASCVPVAGEPTVVRAVRALVGTVAEPRVVVVVAEPHAARVRDVLAAHELSAVVVVAAHADSDRVDVIRAGLDTVASQHESPVLLHDVGHPLVPAAVAARVLAEVRAGRPFVVPVIPMTDSVKSVDERGVVTATVNRTTLLSAQYPRGFAASTLRGLPTGGGADELTAGLPISAVEGHADGGRFTMPRDLALLEAIIGSRA